MKDFSLLVVVRCSSKYGSNTTFLKYLPRRVDIWQISSWRTLILPRLWTFSQYYLFLLMNARLDDTCHLKNRSNVNRVWTREWNVHSTNKYWASSMWQALSAWLHSEQNRDMPPAVIHSDEWRHSVIVTEEYINGIVCWVVISAGAREGKYQRCMHVGMWGSLRSIASAIGKISGLMWEMNNVMKTWELIRWLGKGIPVKGYVWSKSPKACLRHITEAV